MKEIEQLQQAITRLRSDLLATNLALCAVASSLPPEQQKTLMKAFVELAVMQEQTAEKSGMPEAVARMQQAHQRLHSALEGTLKMQRKPD